MLSFHNSFEYSVERLRSRWRVLLIGAMLSLVSLTITGYTVFSTDDHWGYVGDLEWSVNSYVYYSSFDDTDVTLEKHNMYTYNHDSTQNPKLMVIETDVFNSSTEFTDGGWTGTPSVYSGSSYYKSLDYNPDLNATMHYFVQVEHRARGGYPWLKNRVYFFDDDPNFVCNEPLKDWVVVTVESHDTCP